MPGLKSSGIFLIDVMLRTKTKHGLVSHSLHLLPTLALEDNSGIPCARLRIQSDAKCAAVDGDEAVRRELFVLFVWLVDAVYGAEDSYLSLTTQLW